MHLSELLFREYKNFQTGMVLISRRYSAYSHVLELHGINYIIYSYSCCHDTAESKQFSVIILTLRQFYETFHIFFFIIHELKHWYAEVRYFEDTSGIFLIFVIHLLVTIPQCRWPPESDCVTHTPESSSAESLTLLSQTQWSQTGFFS